MAAANRQLILLVRKWREGGAASSFEVLEADSTDWPARIAMIKPDIVLSALGTTIKQAGSQAAFRAVDQDLVMDVARAAKAAGAQQMVAVSAIGANAKSGNFYLRVKGEVEAALTEIGFDRLDIIRPGLLLGTRTNDSRSGESIIIRLSPFGDAMLHGPMRKYRSIAGVDVARAMTQLAGAVPSGTFIHEYDDIRALAR